MNLFHNFVEFNNVVAIIFIHIVKPYKLKDAGNNTPANSTQILTSGESTAINTSGAPIDLSENTDGKDDANKIENIEGLSKKLNCGDTVNIECDIEAKHDDKLVASSSTDVRKFWNVKKCENKNESAKGCGLNDVAELGEGTSLDVTVTTEHGDSHSVSVTGKSPVQRNMCKVDTEMKETFNAPSNLSANVGEEDMLNDNGDEDGIVNNHSPIVTDEVEQHKQSEMNEKHASFPSTEGQKTLTVSSRGKQGTNSNDVKRNKDADMLLTPNEQSVDTSASPVTSYDESESDSERSGIMVYDAKSVKPEINLRNKTNWKWKDNVEYEDSRAVYLYGGIKYRLHLSAYKANQLKVYAKNCFSLELVNERNKRGSMKEWVLQTIKDIWDGELVC